MKNIFETDPESHYRFSWDFKVSVNVSWRQFTQEKFVQDVCDILEEEYFPASNLILELTEHCQALDEQILKWHIAEFHKYGVGISADDFWKRIFFFQSDENSGFLTASRSIKALSEIFWCSLPIRSWSSRSLNCEGNLAYRFVVEETRKRKKFFGLSVRRIRGCIRGYLFCAAADDHRTGEVLKKAFNMNHEKGHV